MGRRTSDELYKARTAPRKRGEGSVFKVVINGQVKYRATNTLFMNDKGVAVQVSGTGDSEREAIARRNENFKKRLVQLGQLPASSLKSIPKELKTTTEEMVWNWLDWKSIQTSREHRITPQVVSQYETIIRLHIAPTLGKKPVRLVVRKDIEEFLFKELPSKRKMEKGPDGSKLKTELQLLGLSKLRAIQGVVNMAFKWAYEEKMLLENPSIGVAKIDKPQSPAVKEKLENFLWYPERLGQYLEGHPDEARWLLMISLGLRASEKLGLEWDCFKRLSGKGDPTLEIRQQLAINPTTKKLFINPDTKSRAGTRIIPLDPRMVEVMLRYKKVQDGWKNSPNWNPKEGLENLVFTTQDGKPIRHQTDTKQWRALLAQNDLTFIRQHAMRHIAISNLVKLGKPMEIIRSIAGHESEAITRATYTHLSANSKLDAITGYSDLVFKKRKEKVKGKSTQ
jgi:integrase